MCSKTISASVQPPPNIRNETGFAKQFHRASRLSISNPTLAARLVRSRMSTHQEELWVLALSSAKRLVGFEMIFRGTVDSCLVHPRDVIRFLCESNAAGCIVAHNHPSGDAEPSEQDWDFTQRLARCGQLMEIPLFDHIVVTSKTHTSMASRRPCLFSKRKETLFNGLME
jgi:DNA repair protein RadC